MAQAKRGYANHVLYKGSDESKWAAMYAELVVNFPDMKGFKAQPIFSDKLFEDKLREVTALRAGPRQFVPRPAYIFSEFATMHLHVIVWRHVQGCFTNGFTVEAHSTGSNKFCSKCAGGC